MVDNIQDNMKNIEEIYFIEKNIILVIFKIKKNFNINKKRYCNYNLKEHLFTASSGNFCIRSHSNEGPSSWRNRRKR